MFKTAVETLLGERKIGLSFEGVNIGRKGHLKLLVISTFNDVYMFDMDYFGINGFRWGLASVLGNEVCVKVVHDFCASAISAICTICMGWSLLMFLIQWLPTSWSPIGWLRPR